jgi:phytanoyl-CoA hydroxylase
MTRSLATTREMLTPDGDLTPEAVDRFWRDGYLIVRPPTPARLLDRMRQVTLRDMRDFTEPLEFEADLSYPGAPESKSATGGQTIRRLKFAIGRDPVFAEWISRPELVRPLAQLLRGEVVCPLAHHNCVMTKMPRFSSETGWHQDIRYWSFPRPELITAWLALGDERVDNGCLWVIPGTHRETFAPGQFDEARFLRTDLAENETTLRRKIPVELEAGDVLLFHCLTFHAAGQNQSDAGKYSVVFTFRAADNPPIPGSRSASSPELRLASDVRATP